MTPQIPSHNNKEYELPHVETKDSTIPNEEELKEQLLQDDVQQSEIPQILHHVC